MASPQSFQQTSTPVSFPTTWEATIEGLNVRCNEGYSRLKAAEGLHEVFMSTLALIKCNQDIHDIHGVLSPEQLGTIVMHMRFDGLIQGMRGEGILQLQLYYVNQWLVLAFQRLKMWDHVIQRVSWALELAEDNGQHCFVPWEARVFLRRIRENPRLPITSYATA